MLNPSTEKSLSKLMTKILRHSPEAFGVTLDPEDGSCPLPSFIKSIQAQSGWSWVKLEDLEQVV